MTFPTSEKISARRQIPYLSTAPEIKWDILFFILKGQWPKWPPQSCMILDCIFGGHSGPKHVFLGAVLEESTWGGMMKRGSRDSHRLADPEDGFLDLGHVVVGRYEIPLNSWGSKQEVGHYEEVLFHQALLASST